MADTNKISNPTNEQWFICWNDSRNEITIHGSVLPNQYMETPFIEMDTYESESEWKEILLENGINLDEVIPLENDIDNDPVLIDSLL